MMQASSAIQRLNDYVDQVLSGQIVACEKVKMACQRHKRDMKNSEAPGYPWRFDPVLGARPIDFMERFIKPTKGRYDALHLMGWQCFVLGSIYGWVHKETGLRRYREALVLVGRGNGKTTLVSGLPPFAVSKDNEPGAEVYLLANSKEQARICYEMCFQQVQASPALRGRFRALRDGMYYDKTAGLIRPRASDSRKLDGLNTHLAIFDELHEYQHYKLINVIQRSHNKRMQPLDFYISTMGYVLDGPLMDFYGRFTDAMLEEPPFPQEVADSMFSFICEIDKDDRVDDETCWIKANPSLGVLLDINTLRLDYERSRGTPRMLADFITKQLNVMVDASDATLVDAQVINRNKKVIDWNSLLGRSCYGGFDLSSREDFTAAALVFPLDDGDFFVLQHSWVPRAKVERDNEKIDYYGWAMQGFLTIVEGEYVQQEMVYDWFVQQSKAYAIQAIGYDPANAVTLTRMLQDRGFDCEIVRQGPLTLNDPMKDVREQLLAGKIISNNDPMLRWYLGNVRLRNDYRDREKENWMPTKKNRYRKIDGFMAWLDAHTIYMRRCPTRGQMSILPQITVIDLKARRAERSRMK